MSKNKNNQPIWENRIDKSSKNLFKKVGGSLKIDKRLYHEDILVEVYGDSRFPQNFHY